jgi:hypothetical protein
MKALAIVWGLLFVGGAALGFRKNRRLAQHGLRTTAQVVALNESTSNTGTAENPDYTRIYTPVLTFHTADGRQIRFDGPGSQSPVARPGDVVPVLYDPAHPATAEIDSSEGRGTGVLAIFGAVGIALIAFGVYHLL